MTRWPAHTWGNLNAPPPAWTCMVKCIFRPVPSPPLQRASKLFKTFPSQGYYHFFQLKKHPEYRHICYCLFVLYYLYTILVKNFNYFQHSELKFPVSDQFHWRGPWPQYINFSPSKSNGNDWLVKNQYAIYGIGIIGQMSSPNFDNKRRDIWNDLGRYSEKQNGNPICKG